MLSKKLLDELKEIMKEEFNADLSQPDLHRFATGLVGYFDLLLKGYYKEEYGKS